MTSPTSTSTDASRELTELRRQVSSLRAELAARADAAARLESLKRQLAESEERYRHLVECSPDPIVVHRDGQIILVNRAAVRVWGGETPDDLLGRMVLDLVDPEYRTFVRDRIRTILECGEYTPLALVPLVRLDGGVAHVEVTGAPCIYRGRVCVQAVLRDVSDRQAADSARRDTQARLQAFFDAAFEGLVIHDGRAILDANQALADMLGFTVDELKGRSPLELAAPEFREAIANVIANQSEAVYEAAALRKDGSKLIVEGRGKPVPYRGRIVRAAAVRDITARKAAEESLRQANLDLANRVAERTAELSAANDQLRQEIAVRKQTEVRLQEEQLSLRALLDQLEHDRQLVSYEIHDTFVQDVAGALMMLEGLLAARQQVQAADTQELSTACAALRHGLVDARRFIRAHQAPAIDEHGVAAAIEGLVADARSRGMAIDFTHNLPAARMPETLETATFRLIQEALNNVERHSRAKHVWITVEAVARELTIEIRDDGIGFDPAQVGEGHYGLSGIRQRAHVCGGTATIDSQPGKGTRVVVRLPRSRAGPG